MFSFSRTQKTVALILIGLLILAVAAFFIFQDRNAPATAPKSPSNDNSAPLAQTNLPNAVIFPPPAFPPGSAGATNGDFAASKAKSKDDLFLSFLNRTKSAAQQIQPTPSVPAAPGDFNAQKSTVTADGIILNIEPDEFAFIYPRNFLDSLQNVAQPFIQSEIAGFAALSSIKTDADVRMIEEKLIDVLYASGIYTNEQAATARKTIRFTLPRLQLMDLKVRAQRLSSQQQFKNMESAQKLVFIAPRIPQLLNFVYADNLRSKAEAVAVHGLFFSGLMEKLAELKSAIVPVARAVCGSCSDSAECFQEGASGPEAGSETFRIACRCTGCLSGLGCLDGCGSGVAAIFDPETRICGCGL